MLIGSCHIEASVHYHEDYHLFYASVSVFFVNNLIFVTNSDVLRTCDE